jgi:hypothetical protein
MIQRTDQIHLNKTTNCITDGLFAAGNDFVTLVALALIESFDVDTVAILAKTDVGGAFVDVPTVVRHSHLSVAFGTDAHE